MVWCHLSFQLRLERFVRVCFYRLGHLIGRHPWPHIVVPVLLSLVVGVGGCLLHFRELNDVNEFTPLDSPSRYEYGVAQEFVKRRGRLNRLWVLVQADDGGSLLRREYASSVLELMEHVQRNITVSRLPGGGEEVSYSNLCTGYCGANLPLKLFLQWYTPKNLVHPNIRLAYPISTLLTREIYVAGNLHGVTMNTRGVVMSTKLISLAYFTIIPNTDDGSEQERMILEWEKNVFDLLQVGSHSLDKKPVYPLLKTITNSENFISSEIRRVGLKATPLLAVSMTLIVLFTVVTSFRSDLFRSKPFEALIGGLTPFLAIITAIGGLLWAGVSWQPIVTLTLFLALAVGVDDVYIILHAWHDTDPSLPVAQRMGLTLQEAGPSITITSATNALSFFAGVFCGTPAVTTFCLYAMTAVILSYFFQLCLFSAVLCLCGQREIPGRSCYCIDYGEEVKSDKKQSQGKFVNAVFDTMAGFLVSNLGRAIICLFVVAYWALSLYGFSTMKIDLKAQKLVDPQSPIIAYSDLHEKYLHGEVQQLMIFVNRPNDLRAVGGRQRMLRMVGEFETAEHSYGQPSTVWWYTAYKTHLSYFNRGGNFTYRLLPAWLMGDGGGAFAAHMNLDEDACRADRPACVGSFFLLTSYEDVVDLQTRKKVLDSWRTVAGRYADLNVSIYDSNNFYVDQMTSMTTTTLTTVLAALVCVAGVCLLLIPSLLSVVCATLSVLSINVGVFGGLALWRVNLDPITMAALLMSVGFSVDFTAHISYHYFKGDAQSSLLRLRRAYHAIGWPMLQAGVSTLLAVTVLVFNDTYMVSVFMKAVVLVVLLGLVHGLVILPVVLTALPCQQQEEGVAADDGGGSASSSTGSVDGAEEASTSSSSNGSASPVPPASGAPIHRTTVFVGGINREGKPPLKDSAACVVEQPTSTLKRIFQKTNSVSPLPQPRRQKTSSTA